MISSIHDPALHATTFIQNPTLASALKRIAAHNQGLVTVTFGDIVGVGTTVQFARDDAKNQFAEIEASHLPETCPHCNCHFSPYFPDPLGDAMCQHCGTYISSTPPAPVNTGAEVDGDDAHPTAPPTPAAPTNEHPFDTPARARLN